MGEKFHFEIMINMLECTLILLYFIQRQRDRQQILAVINFMIFSFGNEQQFLNKDLKLNKI